MQQADIDYLFGFIGYGDPRSAIWFIGIEEGGDPTSVVRERHQTLTIGQAVLSYDPVVPTGGNGVWRTCRALAASCGAGDNYLMSNIGPLARRSERAHLPGVDPGAYLRRVRRERVPRLIAALRHFEPRVVVFHGKGAWQRYGIREALDLPPGPGAPGEPRVLAYASARVLLTNSFSRRGNIFSKEDEQWVQHYLKAWCLQQGT